MDLDLPTTKRYDLIQLLGGKCRICPETNPARIEIDHIYNDGDIERTKYGSSEKIWDYYLRNENLAFKRLQPLCKSCHKAKTWSSSSSGDDEKIDLGILTGKPREEVSKMHLFMETLKKLETNEKLAVCEFDLIHALVMTEKFEEKEARNYLRRMLREASIYESKPGHYNRV